MLRLAIVGIVLGFLSADGPSVHDDMAGLAARFLSSLSEEQLAVARRPIDDENRFDWHYIPRSRAGLAIRDMSDEQRRRLHALLRSTLSSQGYMQTNAVMELEQVLSDLAAAQGRRADHRNPELFYLTVFGEPSESAWGWRLEGHHLSLNFSSAGGEVVGVTPYFYGANPAEVRGHRLAGLQVLDDETSLAWSLLRSFNDGQRAAAIVSTQAPRDIILSPGVNRLEGVQGLPVTDMTDAQREVVRDLIHAYVHDLEDDLAAEQLERLGEDGFARIRFAWMGATEPGEPHYWRLHAGSFVIEYDNVQGGANHIHTVWRDLERDFGGDPLLEHLQSHHRDD